MDVKGLIIQLKISLPNFTVAVLGSHDTLAVSHAFPVRASPIPDATPSANFVNPQL